jgi:hypothetical protein
VYDAPLSLDADIFLTRRAQLPLVDVRALLEAPVNESDPFSAARCPLPPERMNELLNETRNEFSRPGAYCRFCGPGSWITSRTASTLHHLKVLQIHYTECQGSQQTKYIVRHLSSLHVCRFALPEDPQEVIELATMHSRLSDMADLWTQYTAIQACAIAAMLLMYARFWLFQASVGSVPRAVMVFLMDGISISALVLCFIVLSAALIHILVGPTLTESSVLVSGLTSLSETFLTGSTSMLEDIYQVSCVGCMAQLLLCPIVATRMHCFRGIEIHCL